jgi:hypothetical protein
VFLCFVANESDFDTLFSEWRISATQTAGNCIGYKNCMQHHLYSPERVNLLTSPTVLQASTIFMIHTFTGQMTLECGHYFGL